MNDNCDYCGAPINDDQRGLCGTCHLEERADLARLLTLVTPAHHSS